MLYLVTEKVDFFMFSPQKLLIAILQYCAVVYFVTKKTVFTSLLRTGRRVALWSRKYLDAWPKECP